MSTVTSPDSLGPHVLALDCLAEADRIGRWMVETLAHRLRRRGFVVAISGGIDSSVCAALAVRAVGAGKVFGLLMPERDSSPGSTERGRLLAQHLGIRHEVFDIAPATRGARVLSAARRGDPAGLSRTTARDGAARSSSPGARRAASTTSSWWSRRRTVPSHEARLPPKEYLQIVAATNFKQRVRKTMDYFHADRLNYAVVGTPNRLEYDQGFFVKTRRRRRRPQADRAPVQDAGVRDGAGTAASRGDLHGHADHGHVLACRRGRTSSTSRCRIAQMDLALWAITAACRRTCWPRRSGSRRRRGSCTRTSRRSGGPRPTYTVRPRSSTARADVAVAALAVTGTCTGTENKLAAPRNIVIAPSISRISSATISAM